MKKGADVDAQDKHGYTPLHAVILESCEYDCKYDLMVEILIDNGADFYAQDNQLRTPLAIAMNRGHKKIIKIIRDAIFPPLGKYCKGDDFAAGEASFTEKPDNESDTVDLAGQGEFGGE